MTNSTPIKCGPDDFNSRILAKIAKSRLTRYEGGHVPFEIELRSPEVKLLFAGSFNSFQGNMSGMLAKARVQFPHEVLREVDQTIRESIAECSDRVAHEIAATQKLIEGNVARLVDYADESVAVTAQVISSYGLRYLELLLKTDQLMAMLDTLAAADLISGKWCDGRKKCFKRKARRIAGTALVWQTELKAARTAQDYANWPRGLNRTAAVACRVPVKEGMGGCVEFSVHSLLVSHSATPEFFRHKQLSMGDGVTALRD